MNSHWLRFVLAAVCLVVFVGSACGQTRPFGVMTYNVENLFDTCHDAGFDDYEFLPMAERQWDTRRYRTKLSRLARVIASAGGAQPLALVGLCEVENDSVVYDLCHRTRLARLGYDFVVTHSRDVRGIDVALLYQPLRFRPIAVKAVRVEPPGEYGRHTRDILHVTGLLPTADTLEVFVCHSPSRLGGLRVADDYRRQVAERECIEPPRSPLCRHYGRLQRRCHRSLHCPWPSPLAFARCCRLALGRRQGLLCHGQPSHGFRRHCRHL